MTRSSKSYETLVGLSLLLSSCAGTRPLDFPTASPDEPERRRPPGVAHDPSPVLPTARASADASEQLVVLSAPQGHDADRQLIHRFFDAVTENDVSTLESLFGAEARVKTGSGNNYVAAVQFWKSRLQRLDYGALRGRSVFRDHALEFYSAADLEALGSERRIPLDVAESQIAVRVALNTQLKQGQRLFGDEMVFLLKPTHSGYEIVEIFEEFQIP
jgi:hypothetical protein